MDSWITRGDAELRLNNFMELFLVILMLSVAIVLEQKYKISLYRSWGERLLVSFGCFLILIGWEIINHFWIDAWHYPGPGMIGVYWFGLPIELYLFFFVGPYFSFVV